MFCRFRENLLQMVHSRHAKLSNMTWQVDTVSLSKARDKIPMSVWVGHWQGRPSGPTVGLSGTLRQGRPSGYTVGLSGTLCQGGPSDPAVGLSGAFWQGRPSGSTVGLSGTLTGTSLGFHRRSEWDTLSGSSHSFHRRSEWDTLTGTPLRFHRRSEWDCLTGTSISSMLKLGNNRTRLRPNTLLTTIHPKGPTQSWIWSEFYAAL
jgi:hypothetical protein